MQKIQTSKHPYAGLARVRSAGELVVGLDQNNLPFSTAHPEPAGLDYEIAGLLAEQLGVSLRVYWAYLRARFLPVEAGRQAALRRDPRASCPTIGSGSGCSIRGRTMSRGIDWSSGRAKAARGNGARWPSRRGRGARARGARRSTPIPAPRRSWRPWRRAGSRRAT